MRFGVLGTGVVGRTIGSKLVSLGHEVKMGSRDPENSVATEWAESAGDLGSHGTFGDAGEFGEILVNCTSGTVTLEMLGSIRPIDTAGKILIDISNPLDFSQGFPPTLTICNTDSLGEQIQNSYGPAKVVKALNTMNVDVMVDPGKLAGPHDVFICGDDDIAKGTVADVLKSFGWPEESIVDLGDITAARGLEMFLPLWLRLYGTLGSGAFNIHIAR